MILEHKARKNELESFVYDMRSNVQEYGNLEKYIDPKIKDKYLADINHTVEWLYGDGQNAAGTEYSKKLEDFKKIGLPVKERYRFHSEFPIYYEQFKAF